MKSEQRTPASFGGAENKLNTEHVSGEISKEKWTGGLEAVAHTEK
jgi:hypothetical protein